MKGRVIVETGDRRDIIFGYTSVEASQTNEVEEVPSDSPWIERRLTGRRFLTVHAEFDPTKVEAPKEPEPDLARVDRLTGNMHWSKGDEERLKTRVRRVKGEKG